MFIFNFRCYMLIYCLQNRRNLPSKIARIRLRHRWCLHWGWYFGHGASRSEDPELVIVSKDSQCLVQATFAAWKPLVWRSPDGQHPHQAILLWNNPFENHAFSRPLYFGYQFSQFFIRFISRQCFILCDWIPVTYW